MNQYNYSTVFCQSDYLRVICQFIHIKDIFALFSVLSKFHHNFLNNHQQSKLIKKCIEYDFGPKILEQLSIKINYNDKDTPLSKQLNSIYTNYDFWIDAVDKIDSETVKIDQNYVKLVEFGNPQLVKYWIIQV